MHLRRTKRTPAPAREAHDERTVLDQINRRYILATLILQGERRGFRASFEHPVNCSVLAKGFDMTFHNDASFLRDNLRKLLPQFGKRSFQLHKSPYDFVLVRSVLNCQ